MYNKPKNSRELAGSFLKAMKKIHLGNLSSFSGVVSVPDHCFFIYFVCVWFNDKIIICPTQHVILMQHSLRKSSSFDSFLGDGASPYRRWIDLLHLHFTYITRLRISHWNLVYTIQHWVLEQPWALTDLWPGWKISNGLYDTDSVTLTQPIAIDFTIKRFIISDWIFIDLPRPFYALKNFPKPLRSGLVASKFRNLVLFWCQQFRILSLN